LGDGWLFEGVLWDEQLDKALWLVEPYGFQGDTNIFGDTIDKTFQGFVHSVEEKGVPTAAPSDLHFSSYTPHLPARLIVRKTNPPRTSPSEPHSGQIQLDFLGLVSNEVKRSLILRNGYWQRFTRGSTTHVTTTPKHVLVAHYGDLFVLPLVGTEEPMATPFRIEPKQSVFTLSATRPTTVKYEAPGATKFELTVVIYERPPLKLESTSGEFEIDLRELIPSLVERWGRAISQQSKFDTPGKNRFDNYVLSIRDRFRQIAGKNPSGIPLIVKAEVQAQDAQGRTVRLPHAYLVDIPEKEFQSFQAGAPPAKVASNPKSAKTDSKDRKSPSKTAATDPAVRKSGSREPSAMVKPQQEPGTAALTAVEYSRAVRRQN
jgi:hypothetical protein